ncbi:MAG: response regulator [Chlorobi bacterium]|nr:response regulator [Chlorobiota bacterium]
MFSNNLNLEEIRSLAKDDKSFQKLVGLFNRTCETELAYERKLFSIIKEGLPNSFWYLKDAMTEEIIFYSDSVESITGYSFDELILMNGGVLSLVDDDDLPKIKEAMHKLRSDDNSAYVSFKYKSKTKEDKEKILRTTIAVMRNKNNEPVYFKALTFDVTDIEIGVEDLQREIEKLQHTNEAKDKFISIVSHDLRTPFTSLLGFSEILLNDQELTEYERREYLEYIYDASKTQLQMVNYLLDWAKLQTGKITIAPKRVNLKTIVTNCISVLTGSTIRKGLEIKSDVSGSFFINADERLITQAITNLLSNAVKFTPSGKKIYVSANTFKKGMIELVVRDEGIGISEDNHAKLFKIDEKLSLTGTDGEKGSGLGLTLVKEIVEKHHGDIWFYSKLNEGTEFHITLPGAKNLILIVEDEETIRELYSMAIKKALPNYEILIAGNGYEAIGIAMEKLPAVIVTDHNMPLMNGIQLIEALSRKYDSMIPVVVISSFIDRELTGRYNELGVTKMLEKPVDYNMLAEIVKELIQKEN